MDESLKNRALKLFEDDQKQLEGAFDSQSDVKAVGIVSTTTITENDDGTYTKTVKEEKAEDLYYDGGAVGKVENQLKEDAETLQALCKDFDDQFITINAQINAKKNQMISLATEASERNCWPGIAYTALSSPIGSGSRPLVTITRDFSSPYTIIEDRTAMEIYKPMAGPDVNYGAENPFEPTSLVTLTSANSGFGHENLRDNGRLEPEDAAREVIADNYNVGGNNPGSPPGNEYLSNFQSSSTLGTGRTDVSTTEDDHWESDFPKEIAPAPGINYSWWYAGVGVGPDDGGDATDTSKTGSNGAERCVQIANEISALISEIKVLRQQRDNIINLTNYNKIKDKKTEKELQNWGANNVRSEQEKRKTANSEVISIINNL